MISQGGDLKGRSCNFPQNLSLCAIQVVPTKPPVRKASRSERYHIANTACGSADDCLDPPLWP